MSYSNKSLITDQRMDNGEWSAVALCDIASGTLLGVHGGNVVDFPVVDGRIVHSTIEHREVVQISLNGDQLLGLVSPPDEVWSGIDFINHSCKPNVGARDRIIIYALRDIVAGEELTMDYRAWDFIAEGIQCWCNSANKCSI